MHGLVHLIGFVSGCRLAPGGRLRAQVSRLNGIFWLGAAALFLFGALLWFAESEWWSLLLFAGLLTSQYVIVRAWKDAKWGTLVNVIILLIALADFGSWRFSSCYRQEVETGLTKSALTPDTLLTENDLQPLSELIQTYIKNSGAVGKPKVRNFRAEFSGQIRKNEGSEWMPFKSEQYNFLASSTRLFFMKARMKYLPVSGFHSFKNGHAFMDIRLLSLFKVQYQSGKEMDIAETVTFFNDMCCLAPATLIDKRIKWLEAGDHKVKAAFTNNGISVSAWLFFNERGELIDFVSNDRYAADGSAAMTQLPWSTPLRNYKDIDGHHLPSYAEAIYTYPNGNLVYGYFLIQHVEYNCKAPEGR